jgi:putative redox protein
MVMGSFLRELTMVEIQIAYEGKLRCSARHVDSGVTIRTDAPKDNMGEGASFSPTDLVAAALGTCMLTTMAIAAQRMELDLSETAVVVTKEMVADPLRRIGRLAVTFTLPGRFTTEQRLKLENAAKTCPVHKSLHPNVAAPVTFNWV